MRKVHLVVSLIILAGGLSGSGRVAGQISDNETEDNRDLGDSLNVVRGVLPGADEGQVWVQISGNDRGLALGGSGESVQILLDQYGGIYLDGDVEIWGDLDAQNIPNSSTFAALEQEVSVNSQEIDELSSLMTVYISRNQALQEVNKSWWNLEWFDLLLLASSMSFGSAAGWLASERHQLKMRRHNEGL